MMTPSFSTFEEYDAELQRWTERLNLVDMLLKPPAQAIIRIVELAWRTAETNPASFAIADTMGGTNQKTGTFLLRASCCNVVQRLSHRRRRFPWLSPKKLRVLADAIHEPFTALGADVDHDPIRLYEKLRNEPLGAASPLTAAEIFWVLIKAGEKHAHGSVGFFCLFNMLWALMERRDVSDRVPARRGSSTAFVAAKCLLPIRILCGIMQRRAEIYRDLADLTSEIEHYASRSSQRDRWLLVCALEKLASKLYDFAAVAANPDEYVDTASKVTSIADLFTTDAPDPLQRWSTVRGYIVRLLARSYAINNKLLGTSKTMMDGLKALLDSNDTDVIATRQKILDILNLSEDEWRLSLPAIQLAYTTCRKSLRLLQYGLAICKLAMQPLATAVPPRKGKPKKPRLEEALRTLGRINERVAAGISDAVDPNAHSMRRIITREVASASAGDQTNFDAPELVGALTIVERSLRISDLEVADALKWAVAGAHTDGSWASRHPVALTAGTSELWPGTSEIVWMLCMAVERKSRLRTADDALQNYVLWLDRTRVDIPREDVTGWPSEIPGSDKVDIAATTSAVNALLSIRDLIEERLWELCEKRFVVKANQAKSLLDIDPVDLGARHEKRLHRRLLRMALETSADDYEKAEYSLVLHGPPGSSKTAMAEALAGDMWTRTRRQRRLIRVTPADFIRQGEARLDSEGRFIFNLLAQVRGVTIVFDEIDDLLKKRDPSGQMSFLRLVVPAMLNRLQDLRDAAPRQEICFIFATNYIDGIEPALTRPGRFDATLPVPYPDAWSRENILLRNMEAAKKANPVQDSLIDRSQQPALITLTDGWPWSTFNKMCRELTMTPAGTAKDIEIRIERHKEAIDDTLSYYRRQNRWVEPSRPLEHELVHSLFAVSRLEDAKIKLKSFATWLQKRRVTWTNGTQLLKQLETEWRDNTARPDEWAHQPERPRIKVQGSGTVPMGATFHADGTTTFRVWAPFALQVAVAGDFNKWSRREHEMERIHERPGVWEVTIDAESARKLNKSPKDGSPPGQYRYIVVTTGGTKARNGQAPSEHEDPDQWRNDPYARSWFNRQHARGVFRNSVAEQSAKPIPSHDGIPASQVVACRMAVQDLLDERDARLARIRDLGFNTIEIHPSLDGTDLRWGLDPRLPFANGLESLRSIVADARKADLQIILGTAWGYGSVDRSHPMYRFDGWASQTYENGIYFRDLTRSCLDLDEPQVCNLIFDHAVECAQRLGLHGVHLMFDPGIIQHQNAQAASLAQDLAQSETFHRTIWLDAALDLHKIPHALPMALSDVSSHLFPKDVGSEEKQPPLFAFNDSRFRHVLAVALTEENREDVATAALTLPCVPAVPFSPELMTDTRWASLIHSLIELRSSDSSPFSGDVYMNRTSPDDSGLLTYLRQANENEALVLINPTTHLLPYTLGEGTWEVWSHDGHHRPPSRTVSAGEKLVIENQAAMILTRSFDPSRGF